MSKAKARHILVASEEKCQKIKDDIAQGKDFAEAAKENSQCPSGQRGGELGEFSKGQMVPEFDAVVFNETVGEVHGPIKTQFGFHLLEITDRKD